MKKTLSLLGLLALAGCMQTAEITRAPAQANLLASVPAERIAENTSKITIRAFRPGEKPNTRGEEIIGAKCTLVSDELRAEIITPQEVVVPKFKQNKAFANRGVPGSIVVRCSGGGATGQTIVTANEKQAATTVGAGAGAAILTTLVTAAVASSTPWTYSSFANVLMTE